MNAAQTHALRAQKATDPGVGVGAESWQGSRAGRGAKPGLAPRSRGRLGGPAASQKKGEAGRRGGRPRSGTGKRQPIAGAGAKGGRGRGPAAGGQRQGPTSAGKGGGGVEGQGPRANSEAGEGGGGSGPWFVLFLILPCSAYSQEMFARPCRIVITHDDQLITSSGESPHPSPPRGLRRKEIRVHGLNQQVEEDQTTIASECLWMEKRVIINYGVVELPFWVEMILVSTLDVINYPILHASLAASLK